MASEHSQSSDRVVAFTLPRRLLGRMFQVDGEWVQEVYEE